MASYTKAVVALLFTGLAAPVTVTAQLSRPQFGVAAGATFPSGGLGSGLYEFDTGWQGMAFLAFGIPHKPVGLRLNGSYGANSSSQLPGPRSVRLLGGEADLTLTLHSRTSPRGTVYVLAGPGLYRVSYTGGYSSSTIESTNIAYNVGGGITVGALFVEARYVHVDGWGNSVSWVFFPITAGVRFGGW